MKSTLGVQSPLSRKFLSLVWICVEGARRTVLGGPRGLYLILKLGENMIMFVRGIMPGFARGHVNKYHDQICMITMH